MRPTARRARRLRATRSRAPRGPRTRGCRAPWTGVAEPRGLVLPSPVGWCCRAPWAGVAEPRGPVLPRVQLNRDVGRSVVTRHRFRCMSGNESAVELSGASACARSAAPPATPAGRTWSRPRLRSICCASRNTRRPDVEPAPPALDLLRLPQHPPAGRGAGPACARSAAPPATPAGRTWSRPRLRSICCASRNTRRPDVEPAPPALDLLRLPQHPPAGRGAGRSPEGPARRDRAAGRGLARREPVRPRIVCGTRRMEDR